MYVQLGVWSRTGSPGARPGGQREERWGVLHLSPSNNFYLRKTFICEEPLVFDLHLRKKKKPAFSIFGLEERRISQSSTAPFDLLRSVVWRLQISRRWLPIVSSPSADQPTAVFLLEIPEIPIESPDKA